MERDREEDALCVEHIVVVEQRRVEGILDGVLHTTFALAVASTHDSHTTILEHGLNVVEVKVDESVDGDNLSDTLCCHAKGVVGLAECLEHREVAVDLTQTLVVDNEERIHVLSHFLHTVESLVNLLVTLETEWDSHDTHGKDTHVLRLTCDDRSSTSTGTATHTCGDECHACSVVEHLPYILDAFLGSLTSLCRTVSCTESFLTQLQVDRHRRIVERLIISITENEGYVVDTFTVHVIYGVATTTTYTDDLDDAILLV